MGDDLQPHSGGRAGVRRPPKRPMRALDAQNFCTETHNQLVSFQNIFPRLHFWEVADFKIRFNAHIFDKQWVASDVQTCTLYEYVYDLISVKGAFDFFSLLFAPSYQSLQKYRIRNSKSRGTFQPVYFLSFSSVRDALAPHLPKQNCLHILELDNKIIRQQDHTITR